MTALAERMPLAVSPKASVAQIGGVPWIVPPASYWVPVSALAHLVVAGQRRTRPVTLEAAGVAVDEARVDRPRLVVADPQPLGHAGAHVVVDDVGAGDQAPGDVSSPGDA